MLKGSTTNNNIIWSKFLRPRINQPVSYNGNTWINLTGKNSEPGVGNDWECLCVNTDEDDEDENSNMPSIYNISFVPVETNKSHFGKPVYCVALPISSSSENGNTYIGGDGSSIIFEHNLNIENYLSIKWKTSKLVIDLRTGYNDIKGGEIDLDYDNLLSNSVRFYALDIELNEETDYLYLEYTIEDLITEDPITQGEVTSA